MSTKAVLKLGASGQDVKLLQELLQKAGFPAKLSGFFDDTTHKVVVLFQKSKGLAADGMVGPKTWAALQGSKAPTQSKSLLCGSVSFDVQTAFQMCPESPRSNIERFLPEILKQLEQRQLGTTAMIRLAIATVYTETRGFVPLSEFKSKFNTSPTGHPFDLYDNRKDLGNQGMPDGERYKGRGFIQLTGRANYTVYGAALKVDLLNHPELANTPEIAAAVLCEYLKKREQQFTQALDRNDMAKARKLVNGGSHGLDVFSASYSAWDRKAA